MECVQHPIIALLESWDVQKQNVPNMEYYSMLRTNMLKTRFKILLAMDNVWAKKAARKKKKGIVMMDLIKLGPIIYNWTSDALTNYPPTPQNKTKKKNKRKDLN